MTAPHGWYYMTNQNVLHYHDTSQCQWLLHRPLRDGSSVSTTSLTVIVNLKLQLSLVHHHDEVIKWGHFPRYWPSVRGIPRSPVNSPLKGQWRGALMFSLICVWINGWENNREAGDLRRYRAHYDVIVMTDDVLKCAYMIHRVIPKIFHCKH